MELNTVWLGVSMLSLVGGCVGVMNHANPSVAADRRRVEIFMVILGTLFFIVWSLVALLLTFGGRIEIVFPLPA